ncbi:HDOD domain-containing protein [Marinobacterium jannaschii]|uniref:HDOD domain-containing protein n=1 Tax=Marinobacterium jannaschii TaxID=64970 RepID=UPI0004848FFD|nr:HDOD domain-containing protein [Marinobacterium jannaschii]
METNPSERHEVHISLEAISKHIDQLPLLPGVVMELIKCDIEDETFYDTLYSLAMSDPPLATFILGYANSASSSPNQSINSLRAALTRVGSHTIVELITALSVAKVFVPTKAEHKALWQHSIETACIASFVCRSSELIAVEPEMAHLCGLLHDIGRFVLFQLAPDALNETDARGWGTPIELVDVEKAVVGFSHADVGFLACKRLNLPPLICNLVRYHHNYKVFNHPKAPLVFRQLALVIQFSDFVSVLVERNTDWKEWKPDLLREKILQHCISAEWQNHSLPVQALVENLPQLIKTSDELRDSLGL